MMQIDLSKYSQIELIKQNNFSLQFDNLSNMKLILHEKEPKLVSFIDDDTKYILGPELLSMINVDKHNANKDNISKVMVIINSLLKDYNYTFYYHNEIFQDIVVSDISRDIYTNDILIQFVKRTNFKEYKQIIFDTDVEVLKLYTYLNDSNLYIDSFDLDDLIEQEKEFILYKEQIEQDSNMLFDFYKDIPFPTDKDFLIEEDIFIPTEEDLSILNK